MGASSTIRQLRRRFRVAQSPKFSNLNLGGSIDCVEFKAGSSKVNELDKAFEFRKVDGIILSDSNTSFKSYVFEGKSLIGSNVYYDPYRGWFKSYLYIRVETNGDLIAEMLVNKNTDSVLPGTFAPKYLAHSYIICPAGK